MRWGFNSKQRAEPPDDVVEVLAWVGRNFFAVMYYAGLRPEEAINLAADNVILPPQVQDQESREGQDLPEDEGWGELHIRSATPDAGRVR